MSFWDGVKKVGKEIGTTAYNDAHNKLHKIIEYENKYEDYSDEDLKRLYNRTSGDKRLAIARVLKRRQNEKNS